ncbi:hypothetical protein KM043_003854 [Ampulex compressa]|nr:hypothetical protein KM043_003854 [Ampulex compressa]
MGEASRFGSSLLARPAREMKVNSNLACVASSRPRPGALLECSRYILICQGRPLPRLLYGVLHGEPAGGCADVICRDALALPTRKTGPSWPAKPSGHSGHSFRSPSTRFRKVFRPSSATNGFLDPASRSAMLHSRVWKAFREYANVKDYDGAAGERWITARSGPGFVHRATLELHGFINRRVRGGSVGIANVLAGRQDLGGMGGMGLGDEGLGMEKTAARSAKSNHRAATALFRIQSPNV